MAGHRPGRVDRRILLRSRLFTEVVPYLLSLCLPVFLRAALRRDLRRAATVGTAALVVATIALTRREPSAGPPLAGAPRRRFIDDAPGRVWDWSDPQLFRPVRRLADGVSPRSVLLGA